MNLNEIDHKLRLAQKERDILISKYRHDVVYPAQIKKQVRNSIAAACVSILFSLGALGEGIKDRSAQDPLKGLAGMAGLTSLMFRRFRNQDIRNRRDLRRFYNYDRKELARLKKDHRPLVDHVGLKDEIAVPSEPVTAFADKTDKQNIFARLKEQERPAREAAARKALAETPQYMTLS